MPAKGPFTIKLSISLTPWMEDGINDVRDELRGSENEGWWRAPYTTTDVIRLAVTEFLESRIRKKMKLLPNIVQVLDKTKHRDALGPARWRTAFRLSQRVMIYSPEGDTMIIANRGDWLLHSDNGRPFIRDEVTLRECAASIRVPTDGLDKYGPEVLSGPV
jgi:hypothetical protein